LMGSYPAALQPLLQAERFRAQTPQNKHFAAVPDEQLYLLIGKTYYRLSDYEKAQEYLKRSLAVNPKNPEAAYYMLVIMDLQKKTGGGKGPRVRGGGGRGAEKGGRGWGAGGRKGY